MMEVQENVTDNFKKIEDMIYSYPLPLLNIKSKVILEAIDEFLPYSCGMEFECFMNDESFHKEIFERIPDIMEVIVDPSEQRYRIPKGLKGMVCLYNICEQMKIHSALDLRSSNHYHFDFTDIFINDITFKYGDAICNDNNSIINKENRNYILKELETWETATDLTKQENWIRFFNPLGTLEIRIGEPTFDYDIIIKRLIQGCKISKYIKDIYNATYEEKRLIRLNQELQNLSEEDKKVISPVNEIKMQLKSRINKI